MGAKAAKPATLHEVPLDRLPADLTIPADLEDRFGYDEEERRLTFDGFMSKDTFDRLCWLSKDLAYRDALEELFRLAVPASAPEPRRTPTVVGWACVAGLVALLIVLALLR